MKQNKFNQPMIKKINLNKVASYKQPATLETDKKVNLVYGLNGTGKSTVSNYLYNPIDPDYSDCFIDRDGDEDILVYNQTFTKENFDEAENLPGVFSLAKENKEAKENIRKAGDRIATFNEQLEQLESKKEELEKQKSTLHHQSKEKAFEIKKKYSGGDRVLDYCLIGLKTKEPLFKHLLQIEKPSAQPNRDVPEIKNEIKIVNDNATEHLQHLRVIDSDFNTIESSSFLKKIIVGNEDSSLYALIDHLQNSDWVKQGKNHLSDDTDACPFCQQSTINTKFREDIEIFFNESYERDIEELNRLKAKYEQYIDSFPIFDGYEDNIIASKYKSELELKTTNVVSALQKNLEKLDRKCAAPSNSIELHDTTPLIESFNEFVIFVNKEIEEFNDKVKNKRRTELLLKNEFWKLMRWNYDQTVSNFVLKTEDLDKSIESLVRDISDLRSRISAQGAIISREQEKTINIETAAESIKAQLIDIGITDFSVEKVSDTEYQIVRGDDQQKIFRSLSEGEKMIISFLYFLELCKGKSSTTDTNAKKVIVIDDPISSLSHIHVFNVSKLIQRSIYKAIFSADSGIEQLLVLTHSLYFYHELVEKDPEKRATSQSLIRLVKSENGSSFEELDYKSIQNDYQAYWAIIKDEDQHPAVIANCMRNIVEYFFSFTEKLTLTDIFSGAQFQKTKFQSFYRYMNRESHSDSQNIFDFKEFDYQVFFEAFKLMFNVSGYSKHFKKMMK